MTTFLKDLTQLSWPEEIREVWDSVSSLPRFLCVSPQVDVWTDQEFEENGEPCYEEGQIYTELSELIIEDADTANDIMGTEDGEMFLFAWEMLSLWKNKAHSEAIFLNDLWDSGSPVQF